MSHSLSMNIPTSSGSTNNYILDTISTLIFRSNNSIECCQLTNNTIATLQGQVSILQGQVSSLKAELKGKIETTTLYINLTEIRLLKQSLAADKIMIHNYIYELLQPTIIPSQWGTTINGSLIWYPPVLVPSPLTVELETLQTEILAFETTYSSEILSLETQIQDSATYLNIQNLRNQIDSTLTIFRFKIRGYVETKYFQIQTFLASTEQQLVALEIQLINAITLAETDLITAIKAQIIALKTLIRTVTKQEAILTQIKNNLDISTVI